MKAMSLGKGSFLVRVKSLGDRLVSGSISFGIRFRKAAIAWGSWHDFSKQDLCHGGQLLRDFWFKMKSLVNCSTKKSISWIQHKCNIIYHDYGNLIKYVSGSHR